MKKTSKAPAHKACPWCDLPPWEHRIGVKRFGVPREVFFRVECVTLDCPAKPLVEGKTRKEARKLWNTRKGEA